MSLKEAFKPTKNKIIVSIVVVLIWYSILFFILYSKVSFCPQVLCENEFPRLIPLPSDCCYTINNFVINLVFVIIVPFVIVYSTFSLKQLLVRPKK
jgi:hypothetical protein